jgi:hypothetical protein
MVIERFINYKTLHLYIRGVTEMKESRKIVKEQYDELNKHAKKHSGGFAIDGNKLIKENPRAVQIDGVYVDADKETPTTIFGKKI